jgi:dihydroorotase
MSHTPALIGGYENQGQRIAKGSYANLVVINSTKLWRVDRDLLLSNSSNTPYHGRELPGFVEHTIFRGKPTLINGDISGEGGK